MTNAYHKLLVTDKFMKVLFLFWKLVFKFLQYKTREAKREWKSQERNKNNVAQIQNNFGNTDSLF